MCIIIDNNVIARVLKGADDEDFSSLHAALFKSKGPRVTVVYGGRLWEEYKCNASVVRLLAALDRAGRARTIEDDAIASEERLVKDTGACVSDDTHVLALARASSVRLLCTHDQRLQKDFTNKNVIDNPRGKIYLRGSQSHNRLLTRFCR